MDLALEWQAHGTSQAEPIRTGVTLHRSCPRSEVPADGGDAIAVKAIARPIKPVTRAAHGQLDPPSALFFAVFCRKNTANERYTAEVPSRLTHTFGIVT